jgi:hypothetical protein
MGREYKMEVTQAQRDQSRQNDFSWQRASESLGCYKGVWAEGHNFPNHEKYNVIVKQSRKSSCYFWKFKPGTFLNAAENLFDKDHAVKTSTRNYRIAIYGLILTIIGLLITIISKRP